MTESVLSDVLNREAEISARLSGEKKRVRDQINTMQEQLESSYDVTLKKLHARFTTSLQKETDRVEQICREKGEQLDIQTTSLTQRTDHQIYAITKELLLGWLEGEGDDHKDVKD